MKLGHFYVYFFRRINLKQIDEQKRLQGFGGMLPRNILKLYILQWSF